MTAKPAPSIFISYRRSDASSPAGRLCDWLKRQFGSKRVFLDTDINYGDNFAQVLESRLAEVSVLIVVIGPDWLDCRNEHGRRLDQPDDYVRMEVETGLRRGIRLIPVLVGGAEMPAADDLPEALKPLHLHNAARIDDHSFRQHFDALVDQLVGPRDPRQQERDRLMRLVRGLGAGALLSAAIAIAIVMAVWTGALSLFNLDTYSDALLLSAADAVDPPPESPGIMLVGIDDASEGALGPPALGANAHWRQLHARLIERAHRAGAEAVVFDMSLVTPTDADDALAGAAARAASGEPRTRVVIGGNRLNESDLAVAPGLRSLPAGSTCLQRRGHRYAVPLAVLDPAADIEATVPVIRPALALLASVEGKAIDADLDRRRLNVNGLRLSESPRFTTIARVREGACQALAANDEVASLMLRPTPPAYWRDPERTMSYAAALDAATPDTRLAGRILLVGDTRSQSRDRHPVRHGLSSTVVPGVQLHADAILSLRHHREPVQLTAGGTLATALLCALTGAIASFLLFTRPPWQRRLAFGVLCVGYLLVAWGSAVFNVLLNLPYDLIAFTLAYLIVWRWQRRDQAPELPHD
ncbi:CHASE2 domain-containing protein [Nitrogeniibacter aestuarii]|uniref:CHASE2 domain-containing protein n=1 Tax=Nitrogeniibacter aestuarii TaxID=2815343 RepID=UPI001E2AA8A6|nr:CHASE2 domain-containing protein [Nitrogeniibacter aestuarii]